jgi:chemotaxis protein histidine kinase CheA
MEPAFDLSEIIALYKEDANRTIELMRKAVGHWAEVAMGGQAFQELRKWAHQLRGSGRTYGFRGVTRVSKAIEGIMIKMQKKTIPADDRTRLSVEKKLERLQTYFKED